MNYLSDLLDHLDASELEAIRSLPLTAKERQVLDLLESSPELTRETAILELTLSGSHYDKLCSAILGKSYDLFAPQGGIARLDFLKQKGLWAHLEHEFKKLEKQLSDEEKPAFYFTTLRHLALYTYEKRYVKLLEKCMEMSFLFDPSPAMTATIQGIRLQIKTHTGFSVASTPEDHDRLYDEVMAHRSTAEATGDPLALLYQLTAEAHCYLLELEGGLALPILQQALSLIDSEPSIFFLLERMRIVAHLAESHYYDDQMEEARERYNELFSGATSDLPSGHYHAVKYAQVLMGLEDFEAAEAILEKWYPLSSFKSNDRRSSAGAVTFVKVYLAQGNLEKTREYLRLAFQANIKAEIVPYEVQLRILEALTFMMAGEPDFGYELFDKVVRYARDKNMIKSAAHIPPMFMAAGLLIKARVELKEVPPEFEEHLSTLIGQARHGALMLRRLRDMSEQAIRTKTKMAAL